MNTLLYVVLAMMTMGFLIKCVLVIRSFKRRRRRQIRLLNSREKVRRHQLPKH